MNRNVAASFGLSVLIVVFFAVALYQRDPPSAPTSLDQAAATAGLSETDPALSNDSRRAAGREAAPIGPRVSTRTLPRHEPVGIGRPIASRSAVDRFPPDRFLPVASSATAVPVARRGADSLRSLAPRGAFTKVIAGESLSDVANRVYGRSDEVRTLWLANRDLLDSAEGLLRPGTLLRTPRSGP
jgi:nucleoid-associated protein YgaU